MIDRITLFSGTIASITLTVITALGNLVGYLDICTSDSTYKGSTIDRKEVGDTAVSSFGLDEWSLRT